MTTVEQGKLKQIYDDLWFIAYIIGAQPKTGAKPDINVICNMSAELRLATTSVQHDLESTRRELKEANEKIKELEKK